jgi:SNF2 family DNA or RNA helicase
LMDAVDEMKPDEKGVFFSQWTSHLDILQRELKKRGHTFCRIQGGMSVDQRLHAMEIFSSEDAEYHQDNNPRFMLCSLMGKFDEY